MPENESFIAFEKDGGIFWRNQLGEPKQVGISMKVADQLKQALSETIDDREACRAERDSYRETLIANGLLEVPKTPEEIAAEALEAAKTAREDMAVMSRALNEQGEILRQLLMERQAQTQTQAFAQAQARPEQKQEQSSPVHAKPGKEKEAGKK